ncbi:MAG: hypothetical protein KYX68_02710 [Flavobacterium sp.]|nr:hypothetical protein [Flavobacterium sp.]
MKAKLLLVALTLLLFGCEKEDNVESEDFNIKIKIINSLSSNDNGYLYGWVDDDDTTYDVEIGADAYVSNGSASLTNNLNVGPMGFLDRIALHPDEVYEINKTIKLDKGAVVEISLQAWNSNTSFWINNNDNVTVELTDWGPNLSDYTITGATGSNPVVNQNNNIEGTWVNLNGCSNLNNQKTYFQFNSDGTGKIYNVDCNSTCTGYGYYLHFSYTDNGDSFTLNYTSVSEYCGYTAPTPSAETINYTKSGNQLTFGGATWTKQ